MKRLRLGHRRRCGLSRPAWGAWIETLAVMLALLTNVSRPAWGAWIDTMRLCGIG